MSVGITWSKRLLLAALVAGGAWMLVGAFAPQREAEDSPPRRVEVKHVRSGDTLKIEPDDKLVYAGIRAPREGEPRFDAARKRNEELVGNREVRVRFDEQTLDHDERLVAYVFTEAEFVNAVLVREGLAWVRLTSEQRRFADQLLAAQREARRLRRGIWAEAAPALESRYAADAKYGEFHRPACPDAGRIKPDRLVEFPNRDDALSKGFAPCSRCRS